MVSLIPLLSTSNCNHLLQQTHQKLKFDHITTLIKTINESPTAIKRKFGSASRATRLCFDPLCPSSSLTTLTSHFKPNLLQSFRWVMFFPTYSPLHEPFLLAARFSLFHFIWITGKLLFIVQVGTLEIFPPRSHAHFLQFFAPMSPF